MESLSEVSGGYVQSLARGLLVIRAFNESHPEMTLSEVARATDMSRAAARRFLHTLVHLGYVWTDGRVFALTPRVLELGFAYLSSVSLPEITQPYLERLVAEVHESASVSVLDGPDIVYVARVPTSRIMTVSIKAELGSIREQGWALVDQELEAGLRSIAAPIRDRSNRVVAAVNISSHVSRTSPEDARRKLLPPLLETAARIGADLAVAPGSRVASR
ncbi:IclR family transcriptional regulator domain-containing protein [Saccharopolyspora hattusasensis]|uniref:IclR family transcriptional regulator domain-containing protein n=1 Tax=Saccharopolyspora hattusasensis TaxID=1128679 RepID=UPI003D98971A